MLAYEILTGDYPIPKAGLSPEKIVEMRSNINRYPPSAKNPQLSAVVDKIVLEALSVEPGKRQRSARELGESLYKALFDLGVSDDKTMIDPPTPPSESRRIPWNLLLAGLILAALLAGGGLLGGRYFGALSSPATANEPEVKTIPPDAARPDGNIKTNPESQFPPFNSGSVTPAPPSAATISPGEILVDIKKRELKGGIAPVTTGDIFKTNDGVRIFVRPTEDIFLRAVMLGSDGGHGEIYAGKIAKRSVGTVPDAGKWLFFDDIPGVETVLLVFSHSDPGAVGDARLLLKESNGRTDYNTENGVAVRVLSFGHVK
jgi:hypothetical protein